MSRRKQSRDAGLDAAIRAAGKVAILAERIGVTPSAISMWKVIPLDRVPDVERATGVSRRILRPDYAWDEVGTEGAQRC